MMHNFDLNKPPHSEDINTNLELESGAPQVTGFPEDINTNINDEVTIISREQFEQAAIRSGRSQTKSPIPFAEAQTNRDVTVFEVKTSLGDNMEASSLANKAVELRPDQVVRLRQIWRGDKRVSQYLVSWIGKPANEEAWIDQDMFQTQFPDFVLEDKAVLESRGIVTYKRRKRKE